MPTLEIPIFAPEDAATAVARGASRLEINRAGSYAAGGLTPTRDEVAAAAGWDVPLRVMIRPRGPPADGPDFVYTAAEVQEMRAAIEAFAASGLLQAARGDGFVFGVLQSDGAVDAAANAALVQAAGPLVCVLHRAFDAVVETTPPETALEQVRACGFRGVLTAGGLGAAGAAAHVDRLRLLLASSDDLEIVVGGGVRSTNAGALRAAGAVSFHASCRTGEQMDGDEVTKLLAVIHTQSP